MSSKPSSSSSSSKPSSSSAAKPSSSSSSSSSSSAKPASSPAAPPAPTAPTGPPPQPTPYISANAWMSFFLFCCLVLIILQGPLGLTGGANVLPSLPGYQGLGALPGCGGVVAAHVPWCVPPVVAPVIAPVIAPIEQPIYETRPQMGGQGQIATPGGGAGWSWHADYAPRQAPRQARVHPRYRSVQYQRPGLQLQVNSAPVLPAPIPPVPVLADPPIPVQPVQGTAIAQVLTQGQNLENAFYPLLVGAIALLVIFDYAS